MQVFHPLGTIEHSLCGGISNAFEPGLGLNGHLFGKQFRDQDRLVKTAFSLPGWMQWHRNDNIESQVANPLVIRCLEPARHEVTQVNLTPVFKLVNDLADDAATSVAATAASK